MITKEKLEHHISHLQEKHDKIDAEIIELYKHHENDLKIETLKKLKLHLKDEIEANKVKMNGLP
jgi:hypothetical protein